MENRRKKLLKTSNQNYCNRCSRKKKERRERERKGGGRGKSGNHKKNKIEEKFSELKEISLQNKWNIMELT